MGLLLKRSSIIIFVTGAVVVALACGNGALFWVQHSLEAKLAESRQLTITMRAGMERLETEKKKITGDNERLSAESLSYLNLNSKLQQERDLLQKKASDAVSRAIKLEESSRQLQSKLEIAKKNIETVKQSQEKKEVTKKWEIPEIKIFDTSSELETDKSLVEYNKGVSFARSGLFDQAISSYSVALAINGSNADAHYNVGLLYWSYRKDFKAAHVHLSRYLSLKPNAEDRLEVEGWLRDLHERSVL